MTENPAIHATLSKLGWNEIRTTVGLGAWGPCRRFTPVLSAVYAEMIEEHPDFEVIFVSLDRNPAPFTEYFGQMPFQALPYEEHEIKRFMTTKSGLVTIPMLVFVDGEGNLITKDGRNIIANSGGDVHSIWEQLRK
ncbi:Nucleoredoxin [Phytophthora megakarya]|uniref:protein-disulfide reductase n=1 Tax=Phytophthora megakarya TaxID=4795 RepID=A0A225WV32_9STRA|nr:Nucleoredoxin [Phytophthora megakarya]